MNQSPQPDNSFDKYDEPRLHMEALYNAHLIEFDLSMRILIPLEDAGIRRLGDLVKHKRSEIRQIKQIGRTSMACLDKLMERLALTFADE